MLSLKHPAPCDSHRATTVCPFDHLPCDVLGCILRAVLIQHGPTPFLRLATSHRSFRRIVRGDPLVYPPLLTLDVKPDIVAPSAWMHLARALASVFSASASSPTIRLVLCPKTPPQTTIEAVVPLLAFAHCSVSVDLTLWVEDVQPLSHLLYKLDSALSRFRLPDNLLRLIHRGAQSPKLAFPWRPQGSWADVGNSTWPISAVLSRQVRPCAGCGEHRVLFFHPLQTSLSCSQPSCASDMGENDMCNRCRPRTQCWECGQAVQCDQCWMRAGWTRYTPLRSVCTSLTHRTGTVCVPWVCRSCVQILRHEQEAGQEWMCEFCNH